MRCVTYHHSLTFENSPYGFSIRGDLSLYRAKLNPGLHRGRARLAPGAKLDWPIYTVLSLFRIVTPLSLRICTFPFLAKPPFPPPPYSGPRVGFPKTGFYLHSPPPYSTSPLLIGIWPGERIVDKVSRFVDIEESYINDG